MLGIAVLAPSIIGGEPRNPSLFEKRFQAIQIAAFFDVDADTARQWVPPPFELVTTGVAPNEKATGVYNLLISPEHCWYRTPNSPPLKNGENIVPDSVVHFWFQIKRPPGTPDPNVDLFQPPIVNVPTGYYYDVVDLLTNPAIHSLYRRAGRPAVLVRDITFEDQGGTQTAEINFQNGGKIVLIANSTLLPAPRTAGGDVWQWHVGGLGEMGDDLGVRLDPAEGNPSNVSTTRNQFLGQILRGVTLATIYADPGTLFEDVFGTSQVTASRTTFFSLNNIALNASRGDLLWTDYPSPPISVPPVFP